MYYFFTMIAMPLQRQSTTPVERMLQKQKPARQTTKRKQINAKLISKVKRMSAKK